MLFETSLTPLPVFGLRREMNRLFDETMNRTTPSAAWAPPVDVTENDSEIAMSIEIPGVKPDDVEVTADNGMLTVRGHKSAERKEGDGTEYHLVERSYGSFTRTFRLPKGVDDSAITANFADGVLDVHVPKSALPQPRKIAIGKNGGTPSAQVEGKASSEKTQQKSVPVDRK
ncbi:MAG: Hsp20/alpha crystallin family protein [Gemmatimonadaceae bacterium]